MKNPEHESGYFEDCSDVEIVFEENAAGDERKCDSGSYGLSKLDVTDSPASPEPAEEEQHHDGGSCCYYLHKFFFFFMGMMEFLARHVFRGKFLGCYFEIFF